MNRLVLAVDEQLTSSRFAAYLQLISRLLAVDEQASLALNHLGSRESGLSGIWAFRYLGSRASGHLGSWALGLPGNLGTWAIRHLGSRESVLSGIWADNLVLNGR
jgi:hypothetical protein